MSPKKNLMAMKGREAKRSKLMNLILGPLRFLKWAKDFYIRGMMSCAGSLEYGDFGGGPSLQTMTSLPKGYDLASSRPNTNDEQFSELLRAVSKRRGTSLDLSSIQEGEVAKQSGEIGSTGMAGLRSYSVGIGKIGRIDEEKPCSFRENEEKKIAELGGRSKSHAVRRNVVYF